MKTLKVVIFEDNDPRRELLQVLLDSADEIECTGAYKDCRDVVKLIGANVPDVVLMDIDMPHVNGIEGLKLIKNEYPVVKVLMQTVFEDEEKIFDAVLAGADGYILKKAPPSKLLSSIGEVMDGGAPMTPTVARMVLKLFNKKHFRPVKTDFNLTNREEEILGLLVEGFSYKMIADKCNVSYATVNTHISHIYDKLQVQSGTEAVAKAINNNIIK